ncbi:MAG: (Fe-S)-binding protein [Gammaproteobacteria bacterium]
MIDMNVFQQFREGIQQMGQMEPEVTLSDEERVTNAKKIFLKKIDRVLATDMESCIHCGHCATACHFAVSTNDPKYTPIRKLDLLKRFYRRELSPLRWMHKLYTRDITLQDLEDWQELIYDSCTECARCAQVCPMGINIASGVNVMREAMAEAELVPVELAMVEKEQCNNKSVFGYGVDEFAQTVEHLRSEGIEVHVDKPRADVFMLTAVIDGLLFNDALIGTIKILNHMGLDWTLSSSNFEAANFGLLSGYEVGQKAASDGIIQKALDLGAKTVLVPECGHAYPALRWDGPNEFGQELPFEILTVSEFVGREVDAGRLKLKKIEGGMHATMHDPCKIARHGGVMEEPRLALDAMGVDLTETPSNREMNWCCGGGAGVFLINRASDLRQKAFSIKIDEVNKTGADTIVVSCGSCRLNFLGGAMQANWQKDIKSFVALVADNLA